MEDALAPDGHGHGTVTVNTKGQIKFAGSLAENTKISHGAILSKQGMWPLHIGLYSGSGSLLSWQKFELDAADDVHGGISWIKLPNVAARHYPTGFVLTPAAMGSRYVKPVGSNILEFAEGQVEFLGGNLGGGFTNLIALQANSMVVNLSANNLSLKFSTANGTFKGKVTDPAGGKPLSFSGVVFQKWNGGAGYLIGTNQSSQVNLGP
jgi:hypothetical protein